jgi:hypothetical protein
MLTDVETIAYTLMCVLRTSAAIAVWASTGDIDHIWIVGSYFHYAGGFAPPQSRDITDKPLWGKGDPMYVVYGRKQG